MCTNNCVDCEINNSQCTKLHTRKQLKVNLTLIILSKTQHALVKYLLYSKFLLYNNTGNYRSVNVLHQSLLGLNHADTVGIEWKCVPYHLQTMKLKETVVVNDSLNASCTEILD
jgi:hypothetical protein